MLGHNICFDAVIWKNISQLFLLPLLIWYFKHNRLCELCSVYGLAVRSIGTFSDSIQHAKHSSQWSSCHIY